MANATATSSAKRAKKNLFKDAAQRTVDDIKKGDTRGTVIPLPTGAGTAELHKAVTDIIKATQAKNEAENQLNLAKGIVGKYAHDEVIRLMVEKGKALPCPIRVVNENNESATYCLVDKSKQYALDNDQVEAIYELLGKDNADAIIGTEQVFGFSPAVMNELVSNKETVRDVVADLLSTAIMNTKRLTTEQKKNLITCRTTKRLVAGIHKNAVDDEVCGRSFAKIKALFTICKSQICRYLQA